jgi:hypothetical protein
MATALCDYIFRTIHPPHLNCINAKQRAKTGCSRAQVKSPDQPNRMQLYEETTRILQPQVDRMKAFMAYHQRAIDQVLDSRFPPAPCNIFGH